MDEVITGLDTQWAAGRNAMSNYLNQRYTIPSVRQALCQGLASSKQENISHTLIEKATVKVTHASLMAPLNSGENHQNNLVSHNAGSQQQEHVSALPNFGQGVGPPQRPAKLKRQEDRVYHIEQVLRDALEQQMTALMAVFALNRFHLDLKESEFTPFLWSLERL